MNTKTLKTLLALLPLIAAPAFAWEAKDLAGKYELTGVMEMAGLLILAPDQKYQAGFSYGAADWVEEGTWKPEGDGVVLSGSRFKTKNAKIPLFLPAGTHLSYKDGKLTAVGPGGKVAFVDPNKTPSHRGKTGEAGEGRMLVKGKVVRVDTETLMVKMKGECLTFAVGALSPEIRNTAKKGAFIDTEIPYSAIISGESCPVE
jgi:hypothetical protein